MARRTNGTVIWLFFRMLPSARRNALIPPTSELFRTGGQMPASYSSGWIENTDRGTSLNSKSLSMRMRTVESVGMNFWIGALFHEVEKLWPNSASVMSATAPEVAVQVTSSLGTWTVLQITQKSNYLRAPPVRGTAVLPHRQYLCQRAKMHWGFLALA